MKTLLILLVLIPVFAFGQKDTVMTYQEGLDHCRRIVQEYRKANPGKPVVSTPEGMIGAHIPVFSAFTLDSNEIRPEYFEDKISILYFWTIQSPESLAAIPGLNAVIEKYGRKRFNYLAVGYEEEIDIHTILVEHPWGFEQLKTGKLLIREFFKLNWGFPTIFVLDKDAIIIAAFTGKYEEGSAAAQMEEVLTGIIEKQGKGKGKR
jgi:thiol-disulfide isomerase/thioredoxin